MSKNVQSELYNLDSLFDLSEEFLCILDADLRYVYTNPAHRKLFGGRDLTGFTVAEAQPEVEQEYVDMLHSVLKEGKHIQIKEAPVTLGKKESFLDMIYAPRRDSQGQINGIFAMGTDVTDKIIALRETEKSANLLKIITDKVPAYVSYTDLEGRYKFLNKMYINWFGKPQEEFIGKTRQEVLPSNYRIISRENESKAFSDHHSHHSTTLVKPDGVSMDLEIDYIADVDPLSKEVRGMVAVGIDMTETNKYIREIERTKKELQDLFNQSPLPMCLLTGEDHYFAMANPKYEEYIGRKAQGRTLAEVFAGEDITLFKTVIKQTLTTEEYLFLGEAPLDVADASGKVVRRYVDAHYHPYRDENNKVIGVLVIVQDVTHRVETSLEIEKLAEDLKLAVKVRDNFLAIASHELKTPITSLRMRAQMQQRLLGAKTPLENLNVEKFVNSAVMQIDKLNRLIDDMLDISRINANKLEMNFSMTDVSELIRDVIEGHSSQVHLAGIKLQSSIEEGLKAEVDGDRFEQVLINLLTNVTRYAPGSTLEIGLKTAGDSFALTVADNGPGIPQDKQNIVFDRFERASSEISGLGLGLYIARSIIDAHGGEIAVMDNEPHGAKFIIRIPLSQKKT